MEAVSTGCSGQQLRAARGSVYWARNLQDGGRSGQVSASKFSAAGSKGTRIGGYEEEPGACVCRNSFAEGKAVCVRGRAVDEVVGFDRGHSFRANVGERHLDVGRWRRP